MSMSPFNYYRTHIDPHVGRCLQTKPPGTGPADEWFFEAEKFLGIRLPPSYKWFLQTYCNPTVNGDDLYSIPPPDVFDEEGTQLTGVALSQRNSGQFPSTLLCVFRTDFGESFFLNTKEETSPGEYPVLQYLGADFRSRYAENYLEFVIRLLREHCGE